MATANRLRRQADTCAALAAATYDEESRERCLRLEQIYRHLAETEEDEDEMPGALAGDGKAASAASQRELSRDV